MMREADPTRCLVVRGSLLRAGKAVEASIFVIFELEVPDLFNFRSRLALDLPTSCLKAQTPKKLIPLRPSCLRVPTV